ncbi:MAG: FAD-binding protein [Alphaproteobacteria bacterium]|nr:FAD-binding protein [Alphaproteobacteria bacterium]
MARNGRGEGLPAQWDDSYDVIVVGYGYAGGVAAIEAAEAGARVLLIEKMPDPGGISICSGGNVRIADDAAMALTYLKATCAGTTPEDVLAVLAEGMTRVRGYFERLAATSGAVVDSRPAGGNYPFPGGETFGFAFIESVPNFDPAGRYPHVNSYVPIQRAAGVRLFKVLEDNVRERRIAVWLEAAAERLLTDADRTVHGLTIRTPSGARRVQARQAVILACGGFEADAEMQRQHWQEKPVLLAAFRGSTGDGIRMAQDVGAGLWHMWNYHGTYGFRHPDPDYPYGLRLKRLPDWMPGKAPREDVRMPWVVVDRNGRRYMNEYPPYMQDTAHRPMSFYDTITQSYPRIPSFMILDQVAKGAYPLCSPTFNDRNLSFEYSEKSLRDLEDRIVRKAGSIAELAQGMKVDAAVLGATIARWNALCEAGADADFGRPTPSMMKIATPPFYVAEVWPICSNTHGGPVHNVHQQVLDVFGESIPRLYAAGELGGVFGHLYLGGGNLAECFIGGWIAGRHAAGLERLD